VRVAAGAGGQRSAAAGQQAPAALVLSAEAVRSTSPAADTSDRAINGSMN
jgi:hypothetical protein